MLTINFSPALSGLESYVLLLVTGCTMLELVSNRLKYVVWSKKTFFSYSATQPLVHLAFYTFLKHYILILQFMFV